MTLYFIKTLYKLFSDTFALFIFVPFNFKLNLPTPWNSETARMAEKRAKEFFPLLITKEIKVKCYNSYNTSNTNNNTLEWPAFLKLWEHLSEGGSNKHVSSYLPYSLELYHQHKSFKLRNPSKALWILCCLRVGTLTKIFYSFFCHWSLTYSIISKSFYC